MDVVVYLAKAVSYACIEFQKKTTGQIDMSTYPAKPFRPCLFFAYEMSIFSL
jgi:hypothetical protein